jgi:exodeoxyribonuclease VII large subunit
VQLILYPALVQGENAPESIIRGIHALEALQVDAMIVGRGGGSIEDLWAFNEEAVARAVFECSVPIISAVGHETDTTIIDYVADLRAPTPSAAAELAVWSLADALADVERLRDDLLSRMRWQLLRQRSRVEQLQLRLSHESPENRLNSRRQYACDLEERMGLYMERKLQEARHRLQLLAQAMEADSPLKKLGEGYSLVVDEQGKRVQDFEQIQTGMRLGLRMLEGDIWTRVEEKQWRNRN